jgi:hypothetical protein
MPVLPPNPPFGGIRCAASPARKMRPSWNLRATSEVARQRASPSIFTGRFGSPTPARTNSIEPCFARVRGGVSRSLRIDLGIADGVHDQEAGLAVLRHAEEAAEHLVVDVDHAERLAEQLRREIRR